MNLTMMLDGIRGSLTEIAVRRRLDDVIAEATARAASRRSLALLSAQSGVALTEATRATQGRSS